MKLIKLTFDNGVTAYQAESMETGISGAKEVSRETFNVPPETFNLLMSEPEKWEIVSTGEPGGFKLKDKK